MKMKHALGNERGAVLVIALLTLTVLTLLSLTAVITATQGLKIGAQYKVYQATLYNADAGADLAGGIVKRAMASAMTVSTVDTSNSLLSFPDTATLESELNGSSANNADTASASPNVILSYPGGTVNVDIDYTGSKLMPGGSTESAARYEGIGSGTSGSVGLYYKVDALNADVGGSQSTIRINFKCVEGGGRCL